MFRTKTSLIVLAGLLAPACASAATFCVAVGGGFGHGGTTYVAPVFTLPAKNDCAAWSGFTKTGSSVIATATGTGCTSTDGKILTLSIFNTDPQFFGAGSSVSDQIQICPKGVTGCPISGRDSGNFGGNAAELTCTTSLLTLPDSHD